MTTLCPQKEQKGANHQQQLYQYIIPQHNVVPFPPPPPESHPNELVRAIIEGVPSFGYIRDVAICATLDLLSKYPTQLSSIDTTINQQFAERAMMQTRCKQN